MKESSFWENTAKISWKRDLRTTRINLLGQLVLLAVLLLAWKVVLAANTVDTSALVAMIVVTIPGILYLWFIPSAVLMLYRMIADELSERLIQIAGEVDNKLDSDTRHSIFRYSIVLTGRADQFYVDGSTYDLVKKGSRLKLMYYPRTRVVQAYELYSR